MRSFGREVRSAARGEGHHRGEDATGLVSMVADGAGRVESVAIDRDWFRRHTTVTLGPALFEAYQAVMTEVLNATVERMEAAEEAGSFPHEDDAVEAAGSGDVGAAAPYVPPTFEDVRNALRALEDRQYEWDYQMSRRLAEASRDQVVRGAYGLVSLTVRGGDVVEIAVSSEVRPERLSTLAQDVVLALRAVRDHDRAGQQHPEPWSV